MCLRSLIDFWLTCMLQAAGSWNKDSNQVSVTNDFAQFCTILSSFVGQRICINVESVLIHEVFELVLPVWADLFSYVPLWFCINCTLYSLLYFAVRQPFLFEAAVYTLFKVLKRESFDFIHPTKWVRATDMDFFYDWSQELTTPNLNPISGK